MAEELGNPLKSYLVLDETGESLSAAIGLLNRFGRLPMRHSETFRFALPLCRGRFEGLVVVTAAVRSSTLALRRGG